MTVGPLGTTRPQQQPEPATTQGFTMTRAMMAVIVMWVAAVVTGVGAGFQWGWPAGLFAFGIMIAVYGILLGIGS